MEGSVIDYLSRIPNELKIAIFCYLDTFDVMQLCDVSANFQDMVFDKHLISKIKVYKDYRFTKALLTNTVLTKGRMETITSLNINCVYWIPAADLRNCIYKLRMLQCLYVVDTELSLNPTDCDMYSALSNLKAIALTVTKMESFKYNRLPDTITELYLHLEIKPVKLSFSFELFCYGSQTPLMTLFLRKLKHLQKLWIIDFSMDSKSIFDKLPSISSSLKKLTFTFNEDSDSIFGNVYSLVTMFRSNTAEGLICLEKCDRDVNPIYRYWNSCDPLWDKLINGLKRGLPFCQSDARKLILKQATVQNIQFSELNLAHNKAHCSKQLKSTIRALLVSSNIKSLKKLSISICLCEQTNDEPSDDQPLSKKSRMNMMSKLPNQCTLEKVIQNSPLIEELEIWDCDSVSNDLLQVTDSALSSIRNLKHLRKLTIQGLPKHLSGEHLLQICKSCTKLESLRIQMNGRNDNVNSYLCTALPHTTALKDFRYEEDHIPIDKIIDSLNRVKNSKLERLVLKCQTFESVNLLILLKTFLSTKHQLRFLCVLASKVSKTLLQQISRSLKKHSDSPEKIFLITHDDFWIDELPIPQIHKREMVKLLTGVSVLDIFNGFENY